MTKRLILISLLAVIIVISFFLYYINALMTKPLLVGMSQPMLIEIKPKSSAMSFVDNLYSKKLISSKRSFLLMLRAQRLTNSLKAGIYQIRSGDNAQDLLNKIVQGDVLVESFKIIEGTRLKQLIINLQNAPYLHFNVDELNQITDSYPSAEGQFLADTYQYDAGNDAIPMLRTAHKKLIEYLQQCWENRSPGLPYKSAYELLIAASILEKETADTRERKLIAGVLVNRLKRGMPLQMDPTVIYALGDRYSGLLKHEDLGVESPYNTYRYRGLPPTPIAMVGKQSIDAAAHPQQTNYLYFVAKGDGTHQFSENYSDQQRAISRFKNKKREH